MSQIRSAPLAYQVPAVVRRVLAVVAGAMLVTLGAQLAVPLPLTPVPVTFQAAAVVFTGALLGPALGAASLALYLVLGASGLPVFAPTAPPGIAILFGPTGGYLLAMPLAAAVSGYVGWRGMAWPRVIGGMLAGLAVIYVGGVAQLTILTGDVGSALKLGSAPFLLFDIGKVLIAALAVRRLASRTRALL
jgi:biotin transport system substrate-specific component